MRLYALKVKIQSLAVEARIIRRAENRSRALWRRHRDDEDPQIREWGDTHRGQFWSLRGHRTGKVRTAARYALLAYALLRGRPYASLEARTAPDDRVVTERLAKEIATFSSHELPVARCLAERWLAGTPVAHSSVT